MDCSTHNNLWRLRPLLRSSPSQRRTASSSPLHYRNSRTSGPLDVRLPFPKPPSPLRTLCTGIRRSASWNPPLNFLCPPPSNSRQTQFWCQTISFPSFLPQSYETQYNRDGALRSHSLKQNGACFIIENMRRDGRRNLFCLKEKRDVSHMNLIITIMKLASLPWATPSASDKAGRTRKMYSHSPAVSDALSLFCLTVLQEISPRLLPSSWLLSSGPCVIPRISAMIEEETVFAAKIS